LSLLSTNLEKQAEKNNNDDDSSSPVLTDREQEVDGPGDWPVLFSVAGNGRR
jgi:hypothetical protein